MLCHVWLQELMPERRVFRKRLDYVLNIMITMLGSILNIIGGGGEHDHLTSIIIITLK